MSAPTLTAVASWDIPLLRGAVWTLDAVADRLPAWRARMEAVGRSLGDADCWYGPAAQSAGAALVEVSTVATAVTAALAESLEHAQRLLAEGEAAQELAEQALATAAAVPVVLDGAGRLAGPLPVGPVTGVHAGDTADALRAEGFATDAMAAGQRAALAATEAANALTGLGVGGALAPATFEDLSWLVAVAGSTVFLPCPPTGGDPAAVAGWWATLSTAQRNGAIRADPSRVGGLEGLPAWARDQANRLTLGRVLADESAPGRAVAVSVAAEIGSEEAEGQEAQLYQFQPEEGLVAVAVGDLDTADHVALLVPGTGNDPVEDLDDLMGDAAAVGDAARAAAPTAAVATIAWMGYRPPSNLATAPSPHHSWPGGRALDATLDGLASARVGTPGGRPHTTLIGHSYGTLVIDRAADERGRLAAHDVVLLGSPGMDNRASELEVERVYEASAPADPITWGEFHGEQTWEDSFGAIELPTDPVMMHWEYYDEWFPTRAAIGEVVAGVREPA
ncbi:hypothetical protein E4P41_02380 [Geodermatophilus sp. DF01-2]|uniref:alpha/beta hydrolase n=1 Tax=Geodermatophilus sp. DF01-2 TaxID=2559610 RepID=UPI0010732CFC|nr:alpha/beta hydrolase [Geodermatophilus sp. DF01_2]TFV64112.1 hypothetical protein E4P41_02380 [Geodermatophilus sp. DF01_2]